MFALTSDKRFRLRADLHILRSSSIKPLRGIMRETRHKSIVVVSAVLCIVILTSFSYFAYRITQAQTEWSVRGQIGDFINSFNVVISLCGFIAIFITIILQMDSLRDQIISNRESKDETSRIFFLNRFQANLESATTLQTFYQDRILTLQNQSATGPKKAKIDLEVISLEDKLESLKKICDRAFAELVKEGQI